MRLLIGFLFALITSTGSYGDTLTLRVLVTQFPPFIDSNAEDGGIAWSALSDFASDRGVAVTPLYRPTARIFTQLESGLWQASVIPAVQSESVAVIEYSDAEVTYSLFSNDPAITTVGNLRIATIRSNSRSGFQDQLRSAGAVIVEVDSFDQGYRMVRGGRVDAVLGVGLNGVAVGAPNPETLHEVVQLAVLPYTLYVNISTPEGREAVRLLTD